MNAKRKHKATDWYKRKGINWHRYEVVRNGFLYTLTEETDDATVYELWTALPGSATSDPLMVADYAQSGRTPRVPGPIAVAKQAATAYIDALDRRRSAVVSVPPPLADPVP